MPDCFPCRMNAIHTWHDNGSWNEEAEPSCYKCAAGKPHIIYDKDSFNPRDRGDDA